MTDQPVTSLERLRETVALRVQATSLRTVARQVGMSPGTLEKFLAGETPYPRSRQRLQEWWARQSAKPRPDVTAQGVEVAIGALVRDLPPEHRVEAIRRVVAALRRVYREQETEEPEWLGRLAETWEVGAEEAPADGGSPGE